MLKKSLKRETLAMGVLNRSCPDAANVCRRGDIAVLRDIGARVRDVVAGDFAVKAEMHDAAGAQQREQDAPPLERVAHVMQHALAVDHIEGAANSAELEDVALRVFDAIRERCRRLAFGVTETAQAEIDREHARALAG